MSINVGLIGAGNISSTHARAVEAVQGAEVVAIYDDNRQKAESLAAAHHATAYGNFEDFLTYPHLNMVIVGTPSGSHAELGIAAARHKLHVLVEKPIDISVNKANQLIGACDRAGVLCGVVLQERFQPANLRLKSLIDRGGLGRLLLVNANVPWYRPPEYYTQSSWHGVRAIDGGGALINQGVHTVDMLLWMMGDVVAVQSRTARLFQPMECEDTAIAILQFANGAVGTLQVTTVAYPGYERRIQISGTEGTVVLEGERIVSANLRRNHECLLDSQPIGNSERTTSSVVSDIGAHKAVIEAFVRAIRKEGPLECDGREGMRSIALVESIYIGAGDI
jgi:UDP-N-acetyl-2-amino-2-deoxyglucuronate dehydrogenase